MLNKIVELIEGGFVAQTLLVIIVWTSIGYLAVAGKPLPDPLLDAGFVMIGFYFRSMIANRDSVHAHVNIEAENEDRDQIP